MQVWHLPSRSFLAIFHNPCMLPPACPTLSGLLSSLHVARSVVSSMCKNNGSDSFLNTLAHPLYKNTTIVCGCTGRVYWRPNWTNHKQISKSSLWTNHACCRHLNVVDTHFRAVYPWVVSKQKEEWCKDASILYEKLGRKRKPLLRLKYSANEVREGEELSLLLESSRIKDEVPLKMGSPGRR